MISGLSSRRSKNMSLPYRIRTAAPRLAIMASFHLLKTTLVTKYSITHYLVLCQYIYDKKKHPLQEFSCNGCRRESAIRASKYNQSGGKLPPFDCHSDPGSP